MLLFPVYAVVPVRNTLCFVLFHHKTLYHVGLMTTDETLVLRYRDGDASAFEELYERYVRRIYDYVYYKTHQK